MLYEGLYGKREHSDMLNVNNVKSNYIEMLILLTNNYTTMTTTMTTTMYNIYHHV